MEITNKFNLPDTIYQAIKKDFHITAGDISVSQLIDAPQIRVLKKLHRNELKQDVSDMIAALVGTSSHAILEQALYDNRIQKSFDEVRNYFIDKKNNTHEASELQHINTQLGFIDSVIAYEFPDQPEARYISERTLHITVDGMTISGTFDLYDKTTFKLQDYKTCSTWAYMFPDSKTSWQAQLNVYAYMMRENGYDVREASIVAIFKDWSKSKVVQNADYPKQPVVEIPIKLYTHEKIGEYIKERVRLHKQAEAGNIPECTSKERWGKADMWAVMVKGAKRALKVVETEQGANKFAELNKDNYEGLEIVHRPGENKRCNEYCQVRDFCEQYKKIKNG